MRWWIILWGPNLRVGSVWGLPFIMSNKRNLQANWKYVRGHTRYCSANQRFLCLLWSYNPCSSHKGGWNPADDPPKHRRSMAPIQLPPIRLEMIALLLILSKGFLLTHPSSPPWKATTQTSSQTALSEPKHQHKSIKELVSNSDEDKLPITPTLITQLKIKQKEKVSSHPSWNRTSSQKFAQNMRENSIQRRSLTPINETHNPSIPAWSDISSEN